MKLETYKADMQNMKDMSEVNEALAMIAKVNNEFDIGSAKSAVERRNLQTGALAEISENPTEKLQAEIERMTVDDEVSRRLQMLSESSIEKLPE